MYIFELPPKAVATCSPMFDNKKWMDEVSVDLGYYFDICYKHGLNFSLNGKTNASSLEEVFRVGKYKNHPLVMTVEIEFVDDLHGTVFRTLTDLTPTYHFDYSQS